MKKWVSKIVTMCLAFAMVVTMLTPVNVQAATKTKSLTLYKGETGYLSNYHKVTSVKSSKKSVVSISKDKSYNYRANFNAKKTGKSTVTIKTNSGTLKYNITVKKLDITAKLTDMGNGYVLLTVKNNTKQTFTRVSVDYTLKNDQGEVVKQDTTTVNNVVAGKTVYSYLYYSTYTYNVDVSQSTAKVTGDSRDLDATYKNVSKKVTNTVTEEDDGNGTLTLNVKTKNTLKKDMAHGYHYILVYNANNEVVALKDIYIGLNAGAVDTDSVKIYYGPYGVDYDHYKIVTVAYSYSY